MGKVSLKAEGRMKNAERVARSSATVVGRVTPCAPGARWHIHLANFQTRNLVHPLLPIGGEGRGEETNKENMRTSDAIVCEAKSPHPNPLPALAGRGRRVIERFEEIVRVENDGAIFSIVPSGLGALAIDPGVKTPGYFQLFLRNKIVGDYASVS